MNHTLSESQLEAMIKSAVNSSGPLPPDEKFSQLISALRELQERRKVERDTEPYGFTDGDRRGMIYKPEHSDRLSEPVPVYRHAQPAPVVSADLLHTAASAIEDLLEHTDPNTSYYSGVWADVPGKLRAAAPHSPGSETATVPGKWIPVSERMPENKPGSYEYLVFEKLNNRVNHDYWNCPDAGDDTFTPFWNHYGEYVTHWMPLPADPQEVKGD